MQSIINILHKNFQDDHTNSRRFPGFPGGFLNSRRFPGVVGTLLVQNTQPSQPITWPILTVLNITQEQHININNRATTLLKKTDQTYPTMPSASTGNS